MQRAMARQAEAERERRAKVINAEGEFQASERLRDAAPVMAAEPIAIQLRYLQTLLEIGATNSTTIVFPAPIDLIQPLIEKAAGGPKHRAEAERPTHRAKRPRPSSLAAARGTAARRRSPRRGSGPCPSPA